MAPESPNAIGQKFSNLWSRCMPPAKTKVLAWDWPSWTRSPCTAAGAHGLPDLQETGRARPCAWPCLYQMKHRCNHRLGSGPINPAPSVCQIGSLTRRVCSGLVAIFQPVVTRAAAKFVKPATPKGADVLSAPLWDDRWSLYFTSFQRLGWLAHRATTHGRPQTTEILGNCGCRRRIIGFRP